MDVVIAELGEHLPILFALIMTAIIVVGWLLLSVDKISENRVAFIAIVFIMAVAFLLGIVALVTNFSYGSFFR